MSESEQRKRAGCAHGPRGDGVVGSYMRLCPRQYEGARDGAGANRAEQHAVELGSAAQAVVRDERQECPVGARRREEGHRADQSGA